MYSAYPTSTDLQTYLATTNLATAGLDLDRAIAGSVAGFQEATGRLPFLAVSGTRLFDPPTGPGLMLDLRADVVGISSIAINGQAQTEGEDYWVRPYNNDQIGKPFNLVEFSAYKWPLRWSFALPQWKQSISITANWGYSTTLPDDVWDALLQGGAYRVYQALALRVSGGLHSARVDDEELIFSRDADTAPLAPEANAWKQTFNEAVLRYARWWV